MKDEKKFQQLTFGLIKKTKHLPLYLELNETEFDIYDADLYHPLYRFHG